MTSPPLAQVCDDVARTLSEPAIDALANTIGHAPSPDREARRHARAAVPVGAFARQAARLVDAWAHHAPNLAGPAVALALRTAAHTVASCRSEQTIDLVWTGPTTRAVPVRLTRAVLLEVIGAADHELVLFSYAAFRVQAVLDALAHAATRGVTIRLVLETTDDSAGALTVDAAHAFASVRHQVDFYIWPADHRPHTDAGAAKLHAKTAIADDHTALITSANLTEHAITANMELGVLIRGGPTPKSLRDHLGELITDGILIPAEHDVA
jgi:phosphatidylserine/phosphatidylglycerophosphate/cardiolipin synthase-like enzyme